jgi:hypothetical protein
MRHDNALNRHVRSPEGPVPAEPTRPLPGLRVGSRQTRGHSPAYSDICEPGSPAVPGAETDRHRATSSLDDLGLEQHPALQTLREPEMGANVFSRPRTWSDPVRFFSQVRGSQFDSVRR